MAPLCPKCPAIELLVAKRNGVEIDYCPQCNGIWLDNGELNKITSQLRQQQVAAPQTKVLSNEPAGTMSNKSSRSVLSSVLDIFDFGE